MSNNDLGFLWQPNQSILMTESERWLNAKREGTPAEPPQPLTIPVSK